MDQTAKKCKVLNHQDYDIEYVCLSNSCNQESRYVCSECIQDNLHLHNYELSIFKQKKLLTLLEKDIQKTYLNYSKNFSIFENEFKKTLDIMNQIETTIKQYKYQYKLLQNIFSEQDSTYFDYLRNLISDEFYSLTEENIKELKTIESRFLNTQNLVLFNQTQEQLLLQTDILYEQIDQALRKQLEQFIDQKVKVKPYVENFSDIDSKIIAYQRSPNNQYLAYITKEKINVYDLWINKQVLSSSLDNDSQCSDDQQEEVLDIKPVLTFSPDSQFIYVNTDPLNENLRMIDIAENHSKRFYQKPFRDNKTFKILPIDTNVVFIYTQENQILKVQFYSPKILLTIQNTFQDLLTFIYDTKHDVLITSCQLIQFWNGYNGDLILQYSQNLSIEQLSLFNNNNLVGSSYNNIYLWNMDYKEKQLILLHSHKLEDQITHLTYIRDEFIVVYGSTGLAHIFDNRLKLLKQSPINSDELIQQCFIMMASDCLSNILIDAYKMEQNYE